MMTSVGIMVGQFPADGVDVVGQRAALRTSTWPLREPWAGDLHTHHCAGWWRTGSRPTPGVREREPPAPRLRNSVSRGLPASLAGASRGSKCASPEPALLFEKTKQGCNFASWPRATTSVVSEPFANKHHVKAGGHHHTATGRTTSSLPSDRYLLRLWSRSGPTLCWSVIGARCCDISPTVLPTNPSLSTLRREQISSTRRAAIQKAIANKSLMMLSNGEIRRQAIRVFDQTFAITYAVEAISILVAIGGISGALISIVMRPEARVRCTECISGARGAQIRKLILVEAGLIGILANILGLAPRVRAVAGAGVRDQPNSHSAGRFSFTGRLRCYGSGSLSVGGGWVIGPHEGAGWVVSGARSRSG